jgi:glycosyltransferase involved in cell wall biosynthesis
MRRAVTTTTHEARVEAEAAHSEPLALDRGPLEFVCLSPQAWRVDLPTNRQQVMERLARHGHDVLYVETETFLGRRVLDAVRRRLRSGRPAAPDDLPARVRTMAALSVLPWGHRFRLPARVNATLTSWALRRRAGGKPRVLWLYDPCFAWCIGATGERFAVYDCVDDYAEQVGGDARRRRFVAQCDLLAASRARLVFATARPLVERHRKLNAKTHLVRNVGDFEHFAAGADEALASPELDGVRSPVIGFAGSLAEQKVDFELIDELARRREWTTVLVGPVYDGTRARVERIASSENVRWVGPVDYGRLPEYVAAFDVAIIPYVANSYTRSCFPLKTFEYLAAGKPVVASGVPELAGMEPHVVVAHDAESFVRAVDDALGRLSPDDVVARQALAAANTWETRTSRLLELVTAEL